MSAIFLSASVPDRENWIESARPHEIREAVVALATTVLPEYELVFGGHPAISPLVEHAARSLGAANRVHIYQSRHFEGKIPEAASKFENFHWTDKRDDQPSSLVHMRLEMLRSHEFAMSFFIGGMEGIFDEHKLFRELCANKPIYLVGSTGSASQRLLEEYKQDFSERGLYEELRSSKLYRSMFARLRDDAVRVNQTSRILSNALNMQNRDLLVSIWPTFKPQLVGSSSFAGGSPGDVVSDWAKLELRRICENSGEQGWVVLKLLKEPKNQNDPQKVAIVSSFLQLAFENKDFGLEALTGLAVVLFRSNE